MNRLLAILLAVPALSMLAAAPAGADEDCEGCKDLSYLARMPRYHLNAADEAEFDSQKFFDGKKVVALEGRRRVLDYLVDEGATRASTLQINRNYAAAIRKAKGTVVFEGTCEAEACGDWQGWTIVVGRVAIGGKDTWLCVEPHGEGETYRVYALERQPMKQDVFLTASDMKSALEADGRVALDIRFETNKAALTREGKDVVSQIVLLLRLEPSLVLSIEGHTDGTGDPKLQQKLSEDRARAVQAALVEKGIDPARLKARGWGFTKPVADDATNEGRARNRRVELVRAD